VIVLPKKKNVFTNPASAKPVLQCKSALSPDTTTIHAATANDTTANAATANDTAATNDTMSTSTITTTGNAAATINTPTGHATNPTISVPSNQ
jgi:hypothetical protein